MNITEIPKPIIVKSDKDTHFSGSLATDAGEAESITGEMKTSSGMIESVSLQSDQNLAWDLYFFATDGHTDTDLDLDQNIGVVSFVAADGDQIAGSGQYYYSTSSSSQTFRPFPYVDEDNTNEMHTVLVNRDSTSKNAGATGEVVIKVGFRPDVKVPNS